MPGLKQGLGLAGASAGYSFGLHAGNLVTNPDDFTNASWTKNQVTVTADQAVAPDGSTTMDKVVPSVVSGTHMVISNAAAITAAVRVSFYAKASGYAKVGFRESNVAGAYATYNLGTGAVIETGNAGGWTVSNPSIVAVGNGVYRCSLTLTPPGSGSPNMAIYILPDAYTTGNPNDLGYAGDGTSAMFLWRAQFYP